MPENATSQTMMLPRNYREAPIRPASLDAKARTVEIVWATDTPVFRFGYVNGEYREYYEILSMDPAHVVLDRFNRGISVLDSHQRWSTDSILGVATDPSFPAGGKESICTVRFSGNSEHADRVFRDVSDGIIRHWSFGYDVIRMEATDQAIDGTVVFRAVKWEPFEISVVPVPADPNAGTREHSENAAALRSCKVFFYRGADMPKPNDDGDGEQVRSDDEETKKKKAAKSGDEEEETPKDEEDKGKKGKKSEEDDDEERRLTDKNSAARAIAAERRRIREIRDAYSAMPHAMDESAMERHVDEGTDADSFRRELIEAARGKQPRIDTVPRLEIGMERGEKKRELMGTAILTRAAPGRYKEDAAPDAREFRGMSLVDMARECLADAGQRVRGIPAHEILSIALGAKRRDQHATSDFPLLLADTINKSLRDAYALAQPTYAPFCRRATVSDFRERHLLQIGDVGRFQKVLEGGEYKATTIGESKESYRVHKYGNRIGLTWEAMINDDLSAFDRIPASIANEAVQHCADIVYDILLSNPKMGDGKALFSAEHGNLGAAADIDLDGMDAAFTSIGEQKNSNGRNLNLSPEFLIFGHARRTKALQYLNDTVVPTTPDAVIPSQMRGLSPIVEGRVSGKQWFLFCPPSRIDTIEYAYLEGTEGLYTEERWGFEVDGLEIKARLVFGAKAVDWRGMYKNPGAA